MKEIFLKKVTLFKGLDTKQLKDVAEISSFKNYKKGGYIFRENETSNALYIIVSGTVKIFKTSPQGRRKTLAILKKGDFFGEMAGLDKQTRSANSQALEDVEVLIIKEKDFEQGLKHNPRIAVNIMETLCARLRSTDRQIEDLVFKSVLGRIGSSLIELSKKYGVKTRNGIMIDLKMSHKELAEMAGTARELATKAVSTFKRNGCLKIINSKMYINPKKLKSWIH